MQQERVLFCGAVKGDQVILSSRNILCGLCTLLKAGNAFLQYSFATIFLQRTREFLDRMIFLLARINTSVKLSWTAKNNISDKWPLGRKLECDSKIQ